KHREEVRTDARRLRSSHLAGQGGALRTGSLAHFTGSCLLLRELEAQLSQLLDDGGHLVAGFEPNLFFRRIAVDHALGRAVEEDVTRLEGPMLRGVADDRLAVEDHVAGVRGLPDLTVDQ